MRRHFTEEDLHTVNKHTIRCSTSLAVREVQVRTTMRYHHIPTGMLKIKNSDNINSGRDVKKLDHLPVAGGTVKWSSHSGRFGSFSKSYTCNYHKTWQL